MILMTAFAVMVGGTVVQFVLDYSYGRKHAKRHRAEMRLIEKLEIE